MTEEHIKFTPAEITAEMISQAYNKWKNAADSAEEAATAYFAAIQERKSLLETQTRTYQDQLDVMNAQRKALSAKVVDLTSCGRAKEAADADAQMEALDKRISGLERKLRVVDSAEPKGDPILYQAVQTAKAELEAEEKRYRDFADSIFTTANQEMQRLNDIKIRVSNTIQYGGPSHNVQRSFSRVDRHFRELDRLEREATERYQAEQEAKKNHVSPVVVIPRM